MSVEKENIDTFLEVLRTRLHDKADKGFVGWDYGHRGLNDDNGRLPATASTPDLEARLESAVKEGNYIDAAAFASFLWKRQVQDVKILKEVEDKI